jgi:hypothetical protein
MNKIIITLLATASMAIAAEEQVAPPRRWDADGDKALNKEEWLARASYRFDMFDTNKDGKVTREEVKAGRKALRQRLQEHREQRRETK